MTDVDRIAVWVARPDPDEVRRLEAKARRRGLARCARSGPDGFVVDGLSSPLRPRSVRTALDLRHALESAAPDEVLLLEWPRDRVIPLENAVASSAGRRRLAVLAGTPEEVPAALGALERGADLVIVAVREDADLARLEELVERPSAVPLRWKSATVERVEPVGLGDRILVDTTRVLRPDDGLLVGSAARFLFGIASEAHGSDFSAPRAFRVNAGAPHSYVLLADGRTKYLSELAPADRLMVARPGAGPSSARVGRLKIERRPMVLVSVRHGGARPTVFLQEAETVRLFGTRNRIAVTDLTPGQTIRGVELPAARHLGRVIDEGVEER